MRILGGQEVTKYCFISRRHQIWEGFDQQRLPQAILACIKKSQSPCYDIAIINICLLSQQQYDLVIAAYSLGEMSPRLLRTTLETLWTNTLKYLVCCYTTLIEHTASVSIVCRY